MKLQEKYQELRNKPSALLATNFYNFETLRGILQAAVNNKSPVILQLTESSIDYMGLPVAVNMAKSAIQNYDVEAWIHLDHGGSYELVARCLDAGFDSVMIDASEKPFKENIELTKKVVKLAAGYRVCVEAELGYIAKLNQSANYKGYTEPGDAKTFVEETGVDALAVAIGTAHGFYKSKPKLDIERLSRIHAETNAALVLHGGSGIPHSMLTEAIRRGICKINIATEIKNVFMQTLRTRMMNDSEIDLRKLFPVAIQAVTSLVDKKLRIVNG